MVTYPRRLTWAQVRAKPTVEQIGYLGLRALVLKAVVPVQQIISKEKLRADGRNPQPVGIGNGKSAYRNLGQNYSLSTQRHRSQVKPLWTRSRSELI